MQEKLKQIIQNAGAHLGHWVKRRRLVIGMMQGQVCVMDKPALCRVDLLFMLSGVQLKRIKEAKGQTILGSQENETACPQLKM